MKIQEKINEKQIKNIEWIEWNVMESKPHIKKMSRAYQCVYYVWSMSCVVYSLSFQHFSLPLSRYGIFGACSAHSHSHSHFDIVYVLNNNDTNSIDFMVISFSSFRSVNALFILIVLFIAICCCCFLFCISM